MAHQTELALQHAVAMHPVDLLDPLGATNIPIQGDYVPLLIFKQAFSREAPDITMLEDSSAVLSMGRPFGFMRGRTPYIFKTQKTNDVVLRQGQDDWHMALETEQPLTPTDEVLFMDGVGRYLTYVESRLKHYRKQAHQTP